MKPRISRKPLRLLYLLVECMGSVRYKSLETLINIVAFMIFVVSRKNICFSFVLMYKFDVQAFSLGTVGKTRKI